MKKTQGQYAGENRRVIGCTCKCGGLFSMTAPCYQEGECDTCGRTYCDEFAVIDGIDCGIWGDELDEENK